VTLLPDAVLRYAAFDEGIIDLHLPSRPNGGLLFLVHGGFWREQYDRKHTRGLARALAELGYLVATPEYRRVDGAGGWPITAEDVAAAYVALPGLLAGLGRAYNRTVTVGHSAGGHLVLWLASRPLTAPPSRTVALAPVADLNLARGLDLSNGAVNAFLSGTPIADADPMSLLDTPPPGAVVLVHGELDRPVPVELSRSFAAAHPWAELIELAGLDHFEFLEPDGPAWQALVDALD
jgi:acetyl esterase/lipase